jgi:hypothetical protein
MSTGADSVIKRAGRIIIHAEDHTVLNRAVRIEIADFLFDDVDEQTAKVEALQWAKRRIEDELNSLVFRPESS